MLGHFKVITVRRNWTVTAASNEDNFDKTAKEIRETSLTRILVHVDIFRMPSYTKCLRIRIKYLNIVLWIRSVTPFSSFISKFVAKKINFALSGYLSGKVNFLLLWNLSRPEVVKFHLHNPGPSRILTAFGVAFPKFYMRSYFFHDYCENLVFIFLFISLT